MVGRERRFGTLLYGAKSCNPINTSCLSAPTIISGSEEEWKRTYVKEVVVYTLLSYFTGSFGRISMKLKPNLLFSWLLLFL